ncbi:hypothetical protein BDR22DRAFT_46879 [Usnea florida]
MRNSFAISSALAARLLFITPLISQCYSAPVADDVPAADDMVNTLVFASSQTTSPTASVVSSNDVPAMSDMVTGSIVFASSGSKTSATATAIFQPTSDDVPAQSDFVTGSIVFATPTTLVTSSK